MHLGIFSNIVFFSLLRPTCNMESLILEFEEKEHSITTHQVENKSFYYCLFKLRNNSQGPVTQKNARKMQNELFEFEQKNPTYYHLFLPQCISCDGNHLAVDCLKRDFKKVLEEKRPPSMREIFAAADYLQRDICVVQYKGNNDNIDIHTLQGYVFAPTNKRNLNVDPVFIRMSLNGGSLEFRHISETDLNLSSYYIRNLLHKHCIYCRFANDISLLFDCVSNVKETDSSLKESNNHCGDLSLTFYATLNQSDRILNIICNFELEKDNLDLFYKYVEKLNEEEKSLNDKKKILQSHVQKVRNQSKLFGEGEFYALSSVFNVDIIVETERGEWKIYMPVVCTNVDCFDSPIILSKEKQDRDTCSCLVDKPEIKGHIGKIKQDIYKTVCMYRHKPFNDFHILELPNKHRVSENILTN